ncbi:MAG: hypothetical protein SVR94_19190 [Pseudomonadota bacterium]|nr:hypothetical protein [Pseudomonadota bacterium]
MKDILVRLLTAILRIVFGFFIGALLGTALGMIIGLIALPTFKGGETIFDFVIGMTAMGAFLGAVIGSSNMLGAQSTGKPRRGRSIGGNRHDSGDSSGNGGGNVGGNGGG